MSCILVTTDMSPAARAAYPHAKRLARAFGLPIRLLHVVDRVYQFNAAEHGDSQDYLEKLTAARRTELEAEGELLRDTGVEVRTTAILGRSIADILLQATTARVLVMATHGYSGFRRFILGSVVSRIVQRSPAPVLVVDASEIDLDPPVEPHYSRVLVGTDLSETATGAMDRTGKVLSAIAPSHITLFHADVVPSRITIARQERFEAPGSPEDYAGAVQARLDDMESILSKRGVTVTERSVTQADRAADALVAQADDMDADLVIVSSHGRGRMSVAWLGSTCDEVLRSTPRPVLVIRPRPEPFEG